MNDDGHLLLYDSVPLAMDDWTGLDTEHKLNQSQTS